MATFPTAKRRLPLRHLTLTGVLLAALVAGGATTAEAAPRVRLIRISFDSPGSDNRSNSSLNAESVTIKNTGGRAIQLEGWTLRDRARHVYTFGALNLRPGRTVTVHTGRGTNTGAHRYWGSGNYIWNNDGDTATLKKPNGATIDTCSYSGSGSSAAC